MRPRHGQRGLAAAAIIVVLILGVLALVLGARFADSSLGLDQRAASEANLRRIAASLAHFATLNQRLPCPAHGSLDDGLEDAATPFATCNSPDGTVPWASLALRRDDALDGWGRKISYRVYSGSTGLTQLGGASMSDCNTNAAATDPVNASGLCPATRQTRDTTFLAGKGLSVQTDSATTGGYAYLLISHGETGLGAYAADGGGRSVLPPAGSLERVNTQAGTTFNQRTRSAAGIQPTDAGFFDDTVLATSIADVVAAARLTPRDWGAPSIASRVFTAAAVEAALGIAAGSLNPGTNANTGQNDVDFGDFRVRAFGSTGRNVSFGQGTSGVGIGSIGSSNTSNNNATINAATSESLRFQFDTPGRYLGITLIDFGTQSGQFERVRFTFDVGGSTVQVTKTACRAGDVLANFTVNPGGDFAEVFVEAQSTSGGADSSRFLIKAIATCPSANPACAAPGAAAGDNCP